MKDEDLHINVHGFGKDFRAVIIRHKPTNISVTVDRPGGPGDEEYLRQEAIEKAKAMLARILLGLQALEEPPRMSIDKVLHIETAAAIMGGLIASNAGHEARRDQLAFYRASAIRQAELLIREVKESP